MFLSKFFSFWWFLGVLLWFVPFVEGDELEEAHWNVVYQEGKGSEVRLKKDALFSSVFGFQQVSGLTESRDRITRLSFVGLWKAHSGYVVFLDQALDRHYFLNPLSEDKGLWIQDTQVGVRAKGLKWASGEVGGEGSLTLPLSYKSRVNSAITRFEAVAGLQVDLKSLAASGFLVAGDQEAQQRFFKNLKFFVQPFGRWYLSRYTTTPTLRGDLFQTRGGEPLPRFLWGLKGVGLSVDVGEGFSLRGSLGRWVVFPYRTRYENSFKLYGGRSYGQHFYLISLSASYKPAPKWKLSLSYLHQGRLDKEGRWEFLLLDDRTSLWSASVSYTL